MSSLELFRFHYCPDQSIKSSENHVNSQESIMSSPTQTWSDRRGMFQKGREVHEPAPPRRPSQGGVADAVRRVSVGSQNGVEKTTSDPTSAQSSPTSQRRRSSGLFNNLNNMKRGSEDYSDRRASHSDMAGSGGLMSGWFNQTFRGIGQPQQKAAGAVRDSQGERNSRGVME